MAGWLGRSHHGRCNVCGYYGHFILPKRLRHDLREGITCPLCGSIARDRFLTFVISCCMESEEVLAKWQPSPNKRVLEPSAYRLRAQLLREKVDYRPITFPGESLESLSYSDDFFDHVITSDVFEHVRRDEIAFREILRVLKPGGFFSLQAALRTDRPTDTRVVAEGDRDIYLAPPEYHDEHTLVYRIYGPDVVDRLRSIGFGVTLFKGELHAYATGWQCMVLCRKAREPLDLHEPWRSRLSMLT